MSLQAFVPSATVQLHRPAAVPPHHPANPSESWARHSHRPRTHSWAQASALVLVSAGVSAKINSQASSKARRSCRSSKVVRAVSTSTALLSIEEATEKASSFDFGKLSQYGLGELEELYIDSLWWYYQENSPILTDDQFDKLKNELYKRESQFPGLTKQEVAFIEAAIAYYRGEPLMSDAEYDNLKKEMQSSEKSKQIMAFVLFNKGETLLSNEQFQDLQQEAAKLGMSTVDLEACTVAQLEEMYVDALWAYYKDGVQILTDEQYDKLRQELSWQGSGFPTLKRYEVEFVKAALAYWSGEAVVSDEEWKELKAKVKSDKEREDVTAFLLYTKGKQALDPETFDKMSTEMRRLGVNVRREGINIRDVTLNTSSDKLKDNVGSSLQMYGALSVIPIALTTLLLWALGLALDSELVPELDLESIFSEDSIPLLLAGPLFGSLLTAQLVNFLDLGGQVMTCTCPACGAKVNQFVGAVEKQSPEIKTKCQSCGTPIELDWKAMKISKAGMGQKFEKDDGEAIDWASAWGQITSAVKDRTDGKVQQLDPKTTFRIWNKSGSGVLNLTEFREAFKQLGIKASSKEIDALFRTADTNGNGEIDYEEFVTIYNAAGASGKFSKSFLRDTFNSLVN